MPPHTLIELLLQYQHHFVTGVPDSVFKHFIIAMNQDSRFEHVITNNEGESCALAAGYHLATGKVPVVYMQNSGLGNAINPLTSLLDENIYSIPTLLLIGWRAVPGEKDEPQHKKMGAITPDLLSLLNIPYGIANQQPIETLLSNAADHFQSEKRPYALLFPRNVITNDSDADHSIEIPKNPILREDLLEYMLTQLSHSDICVTTTGKTSRECYEIRERLGHDHNQDFLTVGSMGCAATIALGVAMQQPKRRVVLIDGDGACLMRMEALVTIGAQHPSNFLHVLVDNNAYESTGSQQTLSHHVNFPQIALGCGYHAAESCDNILTFKQAFESHTQGPHMIVVHSYPHSRPDLGRPKTTPLDNKIAFMKQLGAV